MSGSDQRSPTTLRSVIGQPVECYCDKVRRHMTRAAMARILIPVVGNLNKYIKANYGNAYGARIRLSYRCFDNESVRGKITLTSAKGPTTDVDVFGCGAYPENSEICISFYGEHLDLEDLIIKHRDDGGWAIQEPCYTKTKDDKLEVMGYADCDRYVPLPARY